MPHLQWRKRASGRTPERPGEATASRRLRLRLREHGARLSALSRSAPICRCGRRDSERDRQIGRRDWPSVPELAAGAEGRWAPAYRRPRVPHPLSLHARRSRPADGRVSLPNSVRRIHPPGSDAICGHVGGSVPGLDPLEGLGAPFGFTDVVKRPTARADGLRPGELQHGRELLAVKLMELCVRKVLFTFKASAEALLGPLDGHGLLTDQTFADAEIFIMPGPMERTDRVKHALGDLRAGGRRSGLTGKSTETESRPPTFGARLRSGSAATFVANRSSMRATGER